MLVALLFIIYLILVILHARKQSQIRRQNEINELNQVNKKRYRLLSDDPYLNLPKH